MSLRLYKRPGVESWYVRGTVRGIRVYETCDTTDRKQAEAYKAKRESELYDQAVFGARATVSFQRAALSFLEWEPRSKRTKAYVKKLVAHFGSTLVGKIGQAEADQAVQAILPANAAPATKERAVYAPLSAILNHAHRRGWREAAEFEKPKRPNTKTRWLTPAEALRLIEAAAPHLRPLLLFILCTGARLSEALYLQWADVDLSASKVVFRDTKNGTDRPAALTPAAIATLISIRYEEDEEGNRVERIGPVFLTQQGWPYAQTEKQYGGQIKTGWRAACLRAGIAEPVLNESGKPIVDEEGKPMMQPTATPHTLRHSWASWFYALTKDLLLLKAEGGWKTLSMVERYSHLMPSDMAPEISLVWGASHPKIGVLPVPSKKDEKRA